MLRKPEISSGRVGLWCAPLPYLYLFIVVRVKGKSSSRENKSLVYINLHSTVAQKCHGNFNLFTAVYFNFTHGNFNCGNFTFTHGNFNLFTAILITAISILLTAISIYSRQCRNFTQGNFNFFFVNAHGICGRLVGERGFREVGLF